MQLKSTYLATAVLASLAFQHSHVNAQTGIMDLAGTVASTTPTEITAQLPGFATSTILVTPTTGSILVSSTKGATDDRITAIMVLANADMFVQMMQQQADGNGAGMEQFLQGHGLNPAQGLNLPAIQ